MNWFISKIMAFAYRNYLFSIKNFFTFAEILFWPLIQIFSIGIMSSFLALKPSYLFFLLTGAIISGVLQVSQLDVAYGLLYDVWSKSVKQTFIAPVQIHDFLLGAWLFGIVRGIISFLLLILIAQVAFHFQLPAWPVVVVSLAGIFLNALIIGLTVILFIMLFGQRIDIVAWILSVLLMLICGIYYPVTYLPAFWAKIAYLLPLTYFLEYFRSGYGFTLDLAQPLFKGFLLSFIYLILLFYGFHLSFQRARRTGLLLKLSE